jgi:peptidoglycan/LPS O-acetylase OafA/YrhL
VDVTGVSKFWKLFLASLAVALASAVVPYLADPVDLFHFLNLIRLFSLAWGILVILALWQFRWRGLWFFLGAPVALYWLIIAVGIGWACAHNIKACP